MDYNIIKEIKLININFIFLKLIYCIHKYSWIYKIHVYLQGYFKYYKTIFSNH